MGTVSEASSKIQAFNILKKLGYEKNADRKQGIIELVTFVKSRQETNPEEVLPDTTYVVKRLIQGLSNKDELKRVDYSTALCQLLRANDCIKPPFILSVIEETFQSTEKIVDLVNREIGRALGWLALINSKRLTSPDFDIGPLINNVLNCKPYVELLCMTGLAELIGQVSHKVFQQKILPNFQKQFQRGWEDCSPHVFYILLVANKHHSNMLKEVIKKYWKSERLVSVQNYAYIADILGKASSCKQTIHPVVEVVLTMVREDGQCMGTFWKEIGIPILTSQKSKKTIGGKRALAFNILTQILPDLTKVKKLNDVLDDNLSKALTLCTAKEADPYSKKAAQQLVEKLTECTVSSTDQTTEMCMLKCLIHIEESPSMTNAFPSFIKQISSASREQFIDDLLNTVISKPSWIPVELKHLSSIAAKQWCIRQLGNVCNIAEPAQQVKILQFFFLQSFFTVKRTSKDIPHCAVISSELPEYDQKQLAKKCFTCLSKLLTRQDIGIPKLKNLNQHIDILYELAEYVHTLIKSTDNVELKDTKTSVQVQKEWDKLWIVIQSVHIKRKEEEISDAHPFELLFICNGLQMLEETDSMQDALQDLYVCYEKSQKRRKSQVSKDEPAWIDVILELLLSTIVNYNLLSRVVAMQVLSYLTDHLTSTSIQLLVDALEQTTSGMLGDAGDDVDDDDDDDEEDDDDENGAMEVEEGSDNDDENDEDDDDENEDDDDSDDSGIDEETDITVPDKLKAKVKAALGAAAALSDEEGPSEDENEVEFTDNEMFKLDDVLASAFKSMTKDKKSEKQRQLQLASFKTKVLDLVDVVVKSNKFNNLPASCINFIIPLLNLIEKGMKEGACENLGKKANTTLQGLLRCKLDKTEDNDSLIEFLEELMQYSKKLPIHSFMLDVGKAFLLVMKLLMTDDDGKSPVRTRSKPTKSGQGKVNYQDKVVDMIKTAVEELLAHKPGHCPSAFFHVIFTQYRVQFWPLHDVLLNAIGDSEEHKVYTRTQAAAFLADIVTKESMESSDTDSWTKFVNTWKQTVSKIITEETAKGDKLAKGLLNEVLSLSINIQKLNPDVEIFTVEDLTQLKTVRNKCDRIAKKAIKNLTKHIVLPSTEVKQEKKRKPTDNTDEIDGATPIKKTKNVENQSEETPVNQSSKKSKKKKKQTVSDQNQSVSDQNQSMSEIINQNGTQDSESAETTETTPKKNKKKKNKRKSGHFEMDVEESLEQTTTTDCDISTSVELDESMTSPNSSSKKQKKKKNKHKNKKSVD